MIVYRTAIVGFGPAGSGIILKSLKDGTFEDLINGGLLIIEAKDKLASGNITKYKVNSDTYYDVFLEIFQGKTSNYIDTSKIVTELKGLDIYKGGSIPLRELEKFYSILSHHLLKFLLKFPLVKVALSTKVLSIQVNKDSASIITNDCNYIINQNVVLATGGMPKRLRDMNDYSNVFHSDCLLRGRLDQYLKSISSGKVVIVGRSHSAFSSAWYVNQFNENIDDINILCSEHPKVHYFTLEEAITDGYDKFDENDICTVTSRVFRLAGLRMDGRQLYRSIIKKEPEFLHCSVEIREHMDVAKLSESNDLVILASGYKYDVPNIQFVKKNTGCRTTDFFTIDSSCVPNILDEYGGSIKFFATGMASGFIPRGNLGGEPSFSGQTNGIWYYQNLLAEIIITQIIQDEK